MKPNVNFYVTKINQIIKNTEETGERMHPFYEEVRSAIDEERVADLPAERLTEIITTFKNGTAEYQAMFETVKGLKAPVKALGIHKKLEKAYAEYVEGCQEMVQALENGLDTAAFDAAEMKQDTATDAITFAIQRMTKIILGR